MRPLAFRSSTATPLQMCSKPGSRVSGPSTRWYAFGAPSALTLSPELNATTPALLDNVSKLPVRPGINAQPCETASVDMSASTTSAADLTAPLSC